MNTLYFAWHELADRTARNQPIIHRSIVSMSLILLIERQARKHLRLDFFQRQRLV